MYLFYVDDSGTLDPKDEDRPFYILFAVGIFEHNWPKTYRGLVNCKRALIEKIKQKSCLELKLHECEVKSTAIRIPKKREKSKFLSNLSNIEINDLQNLYYSCLELSHAICMSIIIDKKELSDFNSKTDIHLKAWELLCERIENYMREKHPKHRALIICDDVSKQENAALANLHANFLEKQTSADLPIRRIIEMPLFVRSELCEGVQLADLCAYNVNRSARDNNPEYQFFTRILPYFYNSHNTPYGKLDGLKFYPPCSARLAEWWSKICKSPDQSDQG